MSRKIDDLCDEMRPLAEAFIEKLKAEKMPFVIVETWRSIAVQAAYYAQGREPLETVNAKRKTARLWAISEAENKTTITRTMNSRHLVGEAMDLVPLDAKGRPWWTAPVDVWEKIGGLGESCGLQWGGRWDASPGKLGWDCPHFQIA